jgi:hypothetical protein
MSLPRELRDLILDEVLRGPLTSPSTAREPANGPLQTINTIPRLKPGRFIPSISQVNAQLRAETHQRRRKLRCPLQLDMIVYEDGDTKCTWTNVPVHWQKNDNFALEITVRFQTIHSHIQNEHLRFSVTDIVRKAALAVIFDDGLEWREESNMDCRWWTYARGLSYEPALDSSYSASTRALEHINVVLVSSPGQRTENVHAALMTGKPDRKDVSKICQWNKDNFDFLTTLMRGRMESTFFDALAERGPGYYSWEWHIHYRPFFTHYSAMVLNVTAGRSDTTYKSRSCHICSRVVLVNCRTS